MIVDFARLGYRLLLGRLARLPLKVIPRSAVVRILQGPIRGRKWVVGSAVHACWLGSYELDKQRLFTRFVQPGMTVYDIGANVGFYTLLAAELVGEGGRVLAFEPLPRNLRFLRRHVALNALANIEVFDQAVSDREGTTFFEEGQSHQESHMTSRGTLEVGMTTLDSLLARGLRPGLIKIDVEGAEAMVLRGGERTLRECRPVIFLATHGAEVHRECCELLCGSGYRLSPIGDDSLGALREVLAEPGAA